MVFIQADLSTASGCTKVVNEVTSRFGGIDILVSVVGASSAPSGGFAALTDEEWQKELSINLMARCSVGSRLTPSDAQARLWCDYPCLFDSAKAPTI